MALLEPRTPRGPRAAPSPEREASLHPWQASTIARLARAIVRVLLTPPALVVAAVAGLLFVLLLPVCGVASIAESISRASWALVRDTMSQFRGRLASRN